MNATANAVTTALVGILTGSGVAIGTRVWRRSRISPEEMERRRRLMLLENGKMGDANLLEIRGDFLFYCYDVRGVEYTASQDISELRECLPGGTDSLAGPVLVKYDARNPANSIVLAEQWSGLRSVNA